MTDVLELTFGHTDSQTKIKPESGDRDYTETC